MIEQSNLRRFRFFAYLSLALAVLLGASIAIALLDPQAFFSTVLASPGRLLVRIYHLIAWWIPVYFIVLAVQLLRPRLLTWPAVIVLSAVHLPMLTIATLLHLGVSGPSAPLTAAMVRAFTLRGALLVTSLTLAIESLGLYQLWRALAGQAEAENREMNGNDTVSALPALLPAPIWGIHDDVDDPAGPDVIDGDPDSFVESIPHSEDESELDVITIDELRERMMPDAIEPLSAEDDQSDMWEEPSNEEPLLLLLRGRHEMAPYEDLEEVEAIEYGTSRFDDEDIEDDPDDDFDEELPEIIVERSRGVPSRYEIPIDGVLEQYGDGRYWEIDDGTRDAAEVLRVTLEEFGIQAEVTGIRKGPVITMFEILPAPGVKLEKISNLANNIALRLAASSVRIVAPIPGKHAVGIEIPNRERNIVSFAELVQVDEFSESNGGIPIALGKDIAGEAQVVDLTRMPHLLIAGATGSGKSVCVNSIICSILYRRAPSEVKLILIDPKIVELKFYNEIPHLLTPVITDPKRAFQALQYLIYEMERRYSLLDSLGVRDIGSYNAKVRRKKLATEPIPYIVVLIDEFADLMATSGKELESTVARLAAMSRAVGIHLVLATQRPSTDVITGLIKANIPSRIAFMVASKVDSRIIIDMMGAEKLLGRGDMLFTSATDPFPVRMQGAFLTEDEVERVVVHVKQYGEPEYIDEEIFIEDDENDLDGGYLEDPLMEKAIDVVTNSQKASASYLQRRLKVGYNRAARMVEEMERLGIVGPQNGSKPREVMGR